MSAPTEKTYSVEGMTCAHCELAVREEVEQVAGASSVRVDRATGGLMVVGEGVNDENVRAAVGAAGYRIAA